MKNSLDDLYYFKGGQLHNIRLTSTFKARNGDVCFTKWKSYLKAQEDEDWMNYDQREQLLNELVFDLDGGCIEDYYNLIMRLKKDGFKFYAYATVDGRACHVHTFWSFKLFFWKKELRRLFKARLLDLYGCDPNYASDAHMIPIEDCRHWKTRKVKRLIYKVEGVNEVEDHDF